MGELSKILNLKGVSSSYMHGMGSSYSDPYNKLSGSTSVYKKESPSA